MIKRLLYLIPLLFAFNVYADTLTTGDVSLIKIATGTGIPSTRHWGDKLNSNFDIIAGTFTKINTRLANIDSATASINSNMLNLTSSTQTKTGGVQFGGSILASAFVVNGTTLTAGGGDGSGNTVSHSTFSRTIGQGGDVFQATSPFNAIPGASWMIGLSSINIINVQCFTNTISTEGSTTFNIVRTTESNAMLPTPATIHSSSFTIPIGKRYSPITVPNAISVGNSRDLFSLWITSAPMAGSGGQLPGDYGCTLTYNLRKYDY